MDLSNFNYKKISPKTKIINIIVIVILMFFVLLSINHGNDKKYAYNGNDMILQDSIINDFRQNFKGYSALYSDDYDAILCLSFNGAGKRGKENDRKTDSLEDESKKISKVIAERAKQIGANNKYYVAVVNEDDPSDIIALYIDGKKCGYNERRKIKNIIKDNI